MGQRADENERIGWVLAGASSGCGNGVQQGDDDESPVENGI